MTVGVLEGQDVVALGERVEVSVVLEKPLRQVAVERFAAALIREKEVLRQRIALVPGERGVLVRTHPLLRA